MKFMLQSSWRLILSLFVFSTAVNSNASAQSFKKYHDKPLWIAMMNDPNVNYVEACKAYDAFWNGREKPRNEEDIIGQNKDVNAGSDKDHYKTEHRTKKENKQDENLQQYAFQCKKFENWRRRNAPYVKADGHLMTADERIKAWQQQRVK
jgi:hypothetical protein